MQHVELLILFACILNSVSICSESEFTKTVYETLMHHTKGHCSLNPDTKGHCSLTFALLKELSNLGDEKNYQIWGMRFFALNPSKFNMHALQIHWNTLFYMSYQCIIPKDKVHRLWDGSMWLLLQNVMFIKLKGWVFGIEYIKVHSDYVQFYRGQGTVSLYIVVLVIHTWAMKVNLENSKVGRPQ